MKQQTKKLFYISKQLASNNLSQLLDGLSNSRQFISEAPSHQFLNTLIMSLLDLFANTKNTYVRYLIVSILSQAHTFISQLPSKPEIASIFYDWLKSNDIGIRMLGFKVVQSLYVMFQRDSSIYHYLLSKLRTLQSTDDINNQRMPNPNNLIDTPNHKQQLKKQTVGVLKCLHSLVANSQFLSSNLSNNLNELYSLGQLNIKILLYLSVYAKFQSSAYFKVLKTLWNIYCNQNRQNYTQNGGYIKKSRIINYYFSKLIIKSCYHNYMCIDLYYKVLQHNFSHLQKSIIKIKNIEYSFLGYVGLLPINSISSQQLLDLCYQQFNIKYNISAQLQKRILQNIQHHIQTKTVDSNSLLLTFYLSAQSRKLHQVDSILTTQFVHKFASYSQNQLKKYIKISLTVANYQLAHKMLQHGMNKMAKINQRIMSVMMLFICYCQLHLEESEQLLEVFFTVARNLSQASKHKNFSKLLSCWQKQYKNIDIQYNNSRDNPQNDNSFQKIRKQNKITIKCMQQLSFYQQISRQKNIHINYVKIPAFQQKKVYNKVYFGKKTVLDIFRYL